MSFSADSSESHWVAWYFVYLFIENGMLKGGDGGPVTFDIDSGLKDLRAMLAEGKASGIALPLVEQTLACYEEAKRKVSGAAEVSAVSVYWANRSKS